MTRDEAAMGLQLVERSLKAVKVGIWTMDPSEQLLWVELTHIADGLAEVEEALVAYNQMILGAEEVEEVIDDLHRL